MAKGYRLPNGGLLNEWVHRLRLQWEGLLTPTFALKAQAEGCIVTAETLSMGYMGSIQATYEPTFGMHGLRLSSGVNAFDADYAARIYGYERGLLYAYNYRMYYGRGIRSYLLFQYTYKKAPRLTATAKIGSTYYFDRNTISSGANAIDACHQEDIYLQMRYTF